MDSYSGIKGFIPVSLLDWPGKVCSIIFLGGCGFRCPACHNHSLVLTPESVEDHPLEQILEHLKNRANWVDGVTVTGGEPTMRRSLPGLLRVLREYDVAIKLDTNGSNPVMLEMLLDNELLEAVYMDVKAPLTTHEYSRLAGTRVDVSAIGRSIRLLKSSGVEVVFRTTVIPGYVEEPEVSRIREVLGEGNRFQIQPFRNIDTLDKNFGRIDEFRLDRIEEMRMLFEIGLPNGNAGERRSIAGRAG
ncbi:anaerobic ribonucleoside-triphosphate reductase activating protein [Thermodesulfobacteriota bacterium]